MAGIGGVATLPQYRCRGGIRGCFSEMLPALYEEDFAFSYLYPFSTAYYRKFGYEMGCKGIRYDCKLAYLPADQVSGSCELADAGSRDRLLSDVQELDRLWQQHYNCMILREYADYSFITQADPYRTQEFTWVYHRGNGSPAGYMTYRKEKENGEQLLRCSRMAAADEEGLRGLLILLKSMASDHSRAVFTLPQDCDPEPLLQEFSFGAVRSELVYLGMVRVINVQKVLEKAAYRGSGELMLQIEDPYIPQNNAVFRVNFRYGKAQSVERAGSGIIAGDIPVLSIAEFSRLVTGCLGSAGAVCQQLFFQKPCYLTEYF